MWYIVSQLLMPAVSPVAAPHYRKPTHTDWYLHLKRGVVRCLHDRAREIINTQDNLQKEVDHLARVLIFVKTVK